MYSFLLVSCQKEDEKITLNEQTAIPVASLSTQTIILDKEKQNQDALTVTWEEPKYNFDAANPEYSIMIDIKGNNFSKAKEIALGTIDSVKTKKFTKTFNHAELNSIMTDLKLKVNVPADLDLKIVASLSPQYKSSSQTLQLKATPYEGKLNLSSNWGLVGSATTNGWNGPDMKMYKVPGETDLLVAYVTLKEGQFKFRTNNDWAVNLGGKPALLSAGGDNIDVKTGNYKITLSPVAKKYTIENFSLALVGSATSGGWPSDASIDGDVMKYDPTQDLFTVILNVKEKGEFKIRANNNWTLNFGNAQGENGDLILSKGTVAPNGKNFGAEAGVYYITLDMKKNTFTSKKISYSWALVGDGTEQGWPANDKSIDQHIFNYDPFDDIFYIDEITLEDGEIKLRANNSWSVNFGGDALTIPLQNVILEKGGRNIKSTAGTYSVLLDIKIINSPKMTIKKK